MRGVGGVLTPNKKGDIRYQLVGWVERSETQRMESSAIRLKVSELASQRVSKSKGERVKGKVCEMRGVGGVLTPKK